MLGNTLNESTFFIYMKVREKNHDHGILYWQSRLKYKVMWFFNWLCDLYLCFSHDYQYKISNGNDLFF